MCLPIRMNSQAHYVLSVLHKHAQPSGHGWLSTHFVIDDLQAQNITIPGRSISKVLQNLHDRGYVASNHITPGKRAYKITQAGKIAFELIEIDKKKFVAVVAQVQQRGVAYA